MKKIINFKRFSSIKIGEPLEVQVVEDCTFAKDHYLIGAANNVLIGTNPPPLMILNKKFDFIKVERGLLVIGAATPGGKIVSFCKKHNIANFEFLAHLPGTLGGMLKMNAGLKEFEIFNHLIWLLTCKGPMQKSEIDYGYRYTDINDIIFEAAFELNYGFSQEKVALFQTMRNNQPHEPSAGSCFKNPPNDYAGRLIEAVRLKGKRIGDVGFSPVHANFLVNYGDATFEDAIELIQLAEKKVYEMFNIQLEREIIVIDKRYIR